MERCTTLHPTRGTQCRRPVHPTHPMLHDFGLYAHSFPDILVGEVVTWEKAHPTALADLWTWGTSMREEVLT